MKPMGVGLNLALLKENKFGDPRFLFFFLKGIIIVHEFKIFFLRFSTSDFSIHDLFWTQIPIFDELPKYIMQYLVIAWDNK